MDTRHRGEERDKPDLVASGRWRATRPEVEGHHGYRSNALVSTLANCAWGKLAREFIVAKDDSDLLRAFAQPSWPRRDGCRRRR
jgi:hypothetical protein